MFCDECGLDHSQGMSHASKAIDDFARKGSDLSELLKAIRKDDEKPNPADEICTCADVFGCPHGGRIDEIHAQRETEARERLRRIKRRSRR